MKQQSQILLKDIDGLLDILDQKKLMPSGVSVRAVKNLYKVVILRMLDSRRRMQDARDFEALERSHFMALHHEWRIFKLHQTFINGLPFDNAGNVSAHALKEATQKEKPVRNSIQKLSSETLEQNRLWTAWEEGRGVLLKEFPLVSDDGGRITIDTTLGVRHHSRVSLANWNLMRALTRMMMRGYGSKTSPDLFQTTIQIEGLEQWYTDFKEIGIELKAFDPRNENSGARSFKEANFFAFHGDGNQVMSATETFEFISVLISGGMVSANRLRQEMTLRRCNLSRQDVFGYPFFEENCFKQNLKQLMRQEFGNLPKLVDEVERMSPQVWNEFYSNLMAGSRVSPPGGGMVETADLRSAVMILHYTEALISVYDKDGNGTLNAKELALAAPRFQEFMLKVSPGFVRKFSEVLPKKGSALVADFFSYLVFRGKKPEAPFYDYGVTFQLEKKRGSLGEVSRAKIIQVFKILKDEAASK